MCDAHRPLKGSITTFIDNAVQSVAPLTILRAMKRQAGFSIIELMITITIVGVLMGVGIPGVESYIYNSRLTTQINSLATSLMHARSEAIKLNQRVVVCVSSNGTQCAAGGGGTLWNKGWIVFVDRNGDSNIDAGAPGHDDCAANSTTDCVISVQAAFPGINTLTPAGSVVDVVGYVGSGASRCNIDASIDTLEACPNSTSFFTLCDFRGATYAKAVAISNTGRVASITKQPNGSALTCP